MDLFRRTYNAAVTLCEWMNDAIIEDDVAMAELLLKAGMPTFIEIPFTELDMTLMARALTNHLEIAKLLRKYGAKFMFQYDEPKDEFEWPWGISKKIEALLFLNLAAPGVREWLGDEVARKVGTEPTCCHFFNAASKLPYDRLKHDRSPVNVHTSWPPNVSLETCEERLRDDVKLFWSLAGEIRAIEAVGYKKRNWSILRTKWFKTRGIAMFWLGITQVSGCKPEGVLRKRDREAYEEADMFS
jgi:hypothetical protein